MVREQDGEDSIMWIMMYLLLQGDAVILKKIGSYETDVACYEKQHELQPYLVGKEALECFQIL